MHAPSAPVPVANDGDDGERTTMHVPSAPVPAADDGDDGERTTMHVPSAPVPAADDGDDGERTTMHVPSAPVPAADDGDDDDDERTTMHAPEDVPEVGEEELTHMQGSGDHPAAEGDFVIDIDDSQSSAKPSRPRETKAKRKRKRKSLVDEALDKGTVIGRYVVVERIGTGGMGSVYAAYDPELDRKVAVKVLHSIITDETSQADAHNRLKREAQALARLTHPAVITVHDVGDFRGQVFMAMEFVEGITLKEWMKSKQRSWREIIRVFMMAGRGLSAAHAAELIHRDFKPTNVLLGPDGRARVLDFGLARKAEYGDSASGSSEDDGSQSSSNHGARKAWQQLIADGELSQSMSSLDMNLTQAGAVMGSPAYMAPEQHMSQPTDPRTDQYSFCVTLYEALYGTRPYASEDLRMLIYAIMEGRLHKPARDSGVPSWLRKVVLKGLSAAPNDRYPSMDTLLTDLSRDPSRRLWQVAVGLGAAALLTVGGLAIAWPYLNPPEISEEANAHIEELSVLAHEAAAKALFVYPPANDPTEPTAYGTIQQLEQVDDATRALAQQRAQELRAEFAATLVGIGDRYWEQDEGKAFAIDYYAQALMFDDTNEHASERASLTVGQLANLRRKAESSDFSKGELAAAESLAVLADQDEERKRQRLESMLADADAAGRSLTAQVQLQALAGGAPPPEPPKKKKRPQRPAPEALAVPEVDFEADAEDAQPSEAKKARRDPKAAKEVAAQGQSALDATKWKDAERLFHQALSLDRRCSSALIGLSDLHFDRSEYKMALTYAERAVAAAPKRAGYRIKLGDVYYKVLRYDEAKTAYEAAAKLGSSAAEKRLAKIANKLGG